MGIEALTNNKSGKLVVPIKWDDGPADGLGAMVGAWFCAKEAKEAGCKAMWEIINYIRKYH